MRLDPRTGRPHDAAPPPVQGFVLLVGSPHVLGVATNPSASPFDGLSAGRRRGRSTRSAWRVVRRVALAVVLVATLLVGHSIVGALTAPGSDSVTARLTEWVRDHGGTPLVNFAERLAYKPPKVGGMPEQGIAVQKSGTRAAAAPAVPGSPPARRAGPPPPRAVGPRLPFAGPYYPGTDPTPVVTVPPPPPVPKGPVPLAAPPAIQPVTDVALPDEGVWQTLESAGDKPVLRATYLRADSTYTSYLSAVAWMDTHLLSFELHPGAGEPGGGPWPAGASLPVGERGDVVAAFNSGFRMADARGGFYLGGRTAGTLRDGAASIVFYNDGHVDVGQWGRDVSMSPDVAGVRQNLDLIVDDGQVNPRIDDNSGYRWGATLGNELFVWRSGVGVTKDGALLYASGPRLSAATLAQLLIRAGAVRGMELDINPSWTIFIHYTSTGDDSVPTKLLSGMQRPATLYDSTSSRDFIAARVRS